MTFYCAKKKTNTPEILLKGYVFNHDSERVCQLLSSTNHESLHDMFSNVDGEYSCVYTDTNKVVACRDISGTRPLYVYMDTSGFVGFSFESSLHDTYGEPRMFPKGSYWTSEYPDSIFSINRYSSTIQSVRYDDIVNDVVTLLLRAVEKRASEKRVIVIPDGGVYSEILVLVSNMKSVVQNKPPDDTPKVILSTFGARKLFEQTIEPWSCNIADDRYSYPFLDRDLVSFMRRVSDYWNNVMTMDLLYRLFTI